LSIYKQSLSQNIISLNQIASHAKYNSSNCSNQIIVTDTIVGGKLILLKADTINEIFSGTFEFTVVDSQCDTIKITNGRFDIKD